MNFYDDVYAAVSKIEPGKVATYGQIAAACGRPRASRAVGWALHRNPAPVHIPCHRVVNRFGEPAVCFAFGGAQVQRALLEAEGVVFEPDGTVDLKKYRCELDTEKE